MISIIVTAYNIEKYIGICLESLINQTYKDFEIICIDDGSTDNTLNIIKEKAAKDNRIKYITQKNSGVSFSRNKGLELSNGEYILFLDGDDFVDVTLCEKTIKIAQDCNSDIVVYNVASFDNKTKLIERFNFFETKLWKNHKGPYSSHTYKDNKEFYNGNFSAANKLYKKKFILNNNLKFEENLRFEDVLFHLKSFILAKKINLIAEHLYFYRKNRDNSMLTTLVNKTEVTMDIFTITKLAEEFLKQQKLYDSLKFDLYKLKIMLYNKYFLDSNFRIRKLFFETAKKDIEKFEINAKNIKELGDYKRFYIDMLQYNWLTYFMLMKLCTQKNSKLASKVNSIKSIFEENWSNEENI